MKLTEVQEKWLQELESGKHEQCNGYLKINNKYCCLGVACEFALKLTPEIREEYDWGTVYSFDGQKCVLSRYACNQLGLRSVDGEVYGGYHKCDDLTRLNDSGCPFQEIAALIRANPESVFVQNDNN